MKKYMLKFSTLALTTALVASACSNEEIPSVTTLPSFQITASSVDYTNPKNPFDDLSNQYIAGLDNMFKNFDVLKEQMNDQHKLEETIFNIAVEFAGPEAPPMEPQFITIAQAGDGLFGSTNYLESGILLDKFGIEGTDRQVLDALFELHKNYEFETSEEVDGYLAEVRDLENQVLGNTSQLKDPEMVLTTFVLARTAAATVLWPWPDPIRRPDPRCIVVGPIIGGNGCPPIGAVIIETAVAFHANL